MNVLLVILGLIVGNFSTNNNVVDSDYAGSWEYTVQTPEGAYSGTIVLEDGDDGYKGHIESGSYTYPLNNLRVEEGKMECDLNFNGYPLTVTGTFNGDQLNAVAVVEGMELPFIAKRKS